MFVTKREVSHTREVYPRHRIYAAFIVVYSPCTFIVCSSLLSHVVMRETDGNGVGRLMEATGAAAMLNNCFPLLRYHCMHTLTSAEYITNVWVWYYGFAYHVLVLYTVDEMMVNITAACTGTGFCDRFFQLVYESYTIRRDTTG